MYIPWIKKGSQNDTSMEYVIKYTKQTNAI